MPRDPDATPYSWIPHRGWPSQGYSTTVVPRSEALLGPLMLLIMPLDRSHPRAWGASSPTGLGPRHTTCPHNDRGLTAVCHISKSNERAGPRLRARGGWPILAGNTWSPKIADPPSNRRHRAFRIAVLAREVAEGLAGVPRCGGGERTGVTSRAAERPTGACVACQRTDWLDTARGLKAPSTQVECDHHGVVEDDHTSRTRREVWFVSRSPSAL
ncbi:hypothetical protein F5883DRAFT_107864 [Diaporthe sp. PMI_573]|nr:hypothetical protein F5883DRAFT_107864 [Diaporthaceae sp. PMI_573]